MRIIDVLMAGTIFAGIGITLVVFTRIITDYVLKKNMINKGFVNDDTQAIFKKQVSDESLFKYPSLKWGLIFFFGGISLVLLEFIQYDIQSPLPYGIVTVGVSLGFLIYWFIVRKRMDNK
jgi:hypothetical protein